MSQERRTSDGSTDMTQSKTHHLICREEIGLMFIKMIKNNNNNNNNNLFYTMGYSQLDSWRMTTNRLIPHEKIPENILINGTEEEMEF